VNLFQRGGNSRSRGSAEAQSHFRKPSGRTPQPAWEASGAKKGDSRRTTSAAPAWPPIKTGKGDSKPEEKKNPRVGVHPMERGKEIFEEEKKKGGKKMICPLDLFLHVNR